MGKPERKDETWCKDAVLRWFTGKNHQASASFCQADPPDYDLVINGTAYALEVTSLSDTDAATGIPIMGVGAAMQRLADDIEQDAIAQGILKGSYHLEYAAKPIDGKTKKLIKEKVLNFVRQTSGSDEQAKCVIHEDAAGDRIEVFRWGGKFDTIRHGFGVRLMWDEQILDQAETLLKDAIDTKSKKPPLIADARAKVLGLNDLFAFASPTHYQMAFARNRLSKGIFAAVFVVDNRGEATQIFYDSPPMP